MTAKWYARYSRIKTEPPRTWQVKLGLRFPFEAMTA
jgi:hypothetical protein